MRKSIYKNIALVLSFLCKALYAEPEITIITSLYKGERFIKGFLEEIAKQTIYDDCEHIIINANSPENEEPIIQEFCKKHENVKYLRLDFDPGLYAVWNIGIFLSKGEYITNANVDDRFCNTSLEELLTYIKKRPDVDLVYSDIVFTRDANKPFHMCSVFEYHNQPEFSLENVILYCCPGHHPLWRKSMHVRFGLFDTSYKIIGDHEYWIRSAYRGAKFARYPKYLGAFYCGNSNLSFSKSKKLIRMKESKYLRKTYRKIWPVRN